MCVTLAIASFALDQSAESGEEAGSGPSLDGFDILVLCKVGWQEEEGRLVEASWRGGRGGIDP